MIRRATILVLGLSLLGASCSYGPKAWQQTGNGGSQIVPSVAPTSAPTETIDQLDQDTTKLGSDIDTEMKKNDGDVQGARKESQNY